MPGVILWKGPSEIDSQPIMLIAINNSTNRKTGGMIQTYILRSHMSPIRAAQAGHDQSICGSCQHRLSKNGTCYVNLAQGPTSVYATYKRDGYERLGSIEGQAYLAGYKVRLGAYGDPAAVPFEIWSVLLARVRGITGYTHQWHLSKYQDFKEYCMASCDIEAEVDRARAMGWRTFHVVRSDSALDRPGELLCPASEQAGKLLTCEQCMACGGYSSRNTTHIYIPVHGVSYKQNRFNQLITIGEPA